MKKVSIGGWEFLQDIDKGVYPVFSRIIRRRVRLKKAVNIAVVGEAGEGKSYQGIDIARVLDRNFSEEQIVFTFKEFLNLVLTLQRGRPIVFDEPSYAMSKRDWFKELNKALVLTMESFRFKIHPLIIPVINLNLLDKNIRAYLIQYMVFMQDRGKAIVYRLKAKQTEEGFYRYRICDLEYTMFDIDLCAKPTCLTCKKLSKCNLLRARYERKKAETQDKRYEESLTDHATQEAQEMNDQDLEAKLYPYREQFVKEGHIDVDKLRIVATDELHVKIGHNRCYRIKKRLEMHHVQEFV